VLASLPAPKTTPGTGGSCRTKRIPCCSHHLHRVPRRRRFQQRCGHRSHVWTFCAVKRPTGAYPEVRAEVPCRNPGDLRSEERSGKDALNSRVKARTPVGRSTSCGRFRPARTPTSAHCAAVGRRRLPAGSSAPVTRAGGMRPPEGECSRHARDPASGTNCRTLAGRRPDRIRTAQHRGSTVGSDQDDCRDSTGVAARREFLVGA